MPIGFCWLPNQNKSLTTWCGLPIGGSVTSNCFGIKVCTNAAKLQQIRTCHYNNKSNENENTTRNIHCCKSINTNTQPFNGPFSGTIRVSQYQKGKTNQDFTEARDSEWQWHQLGRKSAPRSILITTPAPHHSVFYRPDALPVGQPTASKHWRKSIPTVVHNKLTHLPRTRMTKTHNTNEQPNETKFKEATLQIYGSVLINKSWYPTLQQSEKTFKHSMKCVISTSNLSAITLPTVNIRFNVPYFFY